MGDVTPINGGSPRIGTDPATGEIVRRCKAKTSRGSQCKKNAIKGGVVCRAHGGANPQAQRKALVRAEIQTWGFTDELVDPGTTLLRLLAQSYRRAAWLAELQRQAYEAADQSPVERWQAPAGILALVGKVYRTTQDGNTIEAHEAIRGLTQLEAAERKFCGDLATKAIAAGLAERQVQLMEQQSIVVVNAVLYALNRRGLVGPELLEAQNDVSSYLLEHG